MINLSTLTQRTYDYLIQESSSSRKEACKLAENILFSIKELNQSDRRDFVFSLKTKIKAERTPQADFLCEALQTLLKVDNWKDGLLGSYRKDFFTIAHPFISYSNHLDKAIVWQDRFQSSLEQDRAVSYGSTFATNKPHRIDDKGNYLLDAVYGATCYDRRETYSGFALSIADGAGGHFGDEWQDARIANTAYSAVKSCVRFLSAYETADELKQDFPSVIEAIKREVQRKSGGEGTTFLGCRAFIEENGVRLIGVNIGDCMMVAWDPQTESFYHLLPSQVSIEGVAIFPIAYRDFEIQYLDQTLPAGSLVFLMSDGIHDLLPYREEEGVYPNQLKYHIRYLEGINSLFKNVPKDAPVGDYLQMIIQKGIQDIENMRQQSLNEEAQIGDDAMLMGIRVTQEGWFHSVVSSIKKWLN